MEKRVSKVEALPRLAPEFRVAAYARVSSEKPQGIFHFERAMIDEPSEYP